MNREKLKQNVNMEIAESRSKLSTCQFTQVGAIIVNPKNNQLISSGYNGTVSGSTHCNEIEMSREDHLEFSNKYEIHAEVNAISTAAKTGISTEDCHLYTTLSPCWNCAKSIKSAGITKVFYKTKYWRLDDSEIEEMKTSLKLDIEQL